MTDDGPKASVEGGALSCSLGMDRLVTTWVTSFEKNFSSCCDYNHSISPKLKAVESKDQIDSQHQAT